MTVITTFIRKIQDGNPGSSRLGQWLSTMANIIIFPALGLLAFLLLWSVSAQNIQTSLGKFPSPSTVMEQFGNLFQEHRREREKAAEFYQRQEARHTERLAQDPDYVAKIHPYTGKATFVDQIGTSLLTVLSGFILAAVIAIPLGIVVGLSRPLHAAINPLVQLFKPVSPLAWLPLVTLVVSAVYVSPDPLLAKSFLTSVITVALCCLWPMVINTSVGVAALDHDLVNVSKVLNLSALTHVRKIVLPASTPMIFTGMRLSLSVAWMVLIAVEMLAQSPGLGKFVWDEFQNGSSDSMGRIMAAVLVIGLIGFLLDRGMQQLQNSLSWDKSSAKR